MIAALGSRLYNPRALGVGIVTSRHLLETQRSHLPSVQVATSGFSVDHRTACP
jgi:hypothetical protein